MEETEFEHIASAMRPKLAAHCHRLLATTHLSEEAEDIVQETLVRLWKMRSKLEAYKSIEALGATIAKNICIDRIRHDKLQQAQYRVDSWDELPYTTKMQCASSTRSDEAIIGKDTQRHIDRALSHLPATQRRMLMMRSEGMSLEEIAAICGATKTSTKTMISTARRAMLKMMKL